MILSPNRRTVFSSLLFCAIATRIAQAQVVPDGTIPTVVEQIGNMEKITGGERVGNNLFHSFETFSVSEGMEAIFENGMDIENIYTRVTGSEISLINGLLKTNGGANFFLINPNGVVFGENARLDVGGSFLATTADSIVFADGKTFGVEPENTKPILTVTAPIGLGFLGNNGSITVNGGGNQITNDSSFSPIEFGERPKGIYVKDSQTLALVGNGINFNGGVVTTEGGKVYLTSVENGSVDISQTENGFALLNNEPTKYQDIYLSQQSLVDTSGEKTGKISLTGKSISLLGGSFVLSQNEGNLSNRSIEIKAFKSLILSDTSPDGEISSSIRSEVLESAEGTGSNLNIFANQIVLEDGAKIRASSFSDRTGGNINITTSDSIKLENSVISSSTFANGDAGTLAINTGEIILLNGSSITSSTRGNGDGGKIDIEANVINIAQSGRTTRSNISASSFSVGDNPGDAGDVKIEVRQLQIRDGGSVSSSSFAAGKGGSITINASESIEISGANPNITSDNPQSTIRTAVQAATPIIQRILGLPASPSGNAGNLTLNTPVLNVTEEGVITVENKGTGNAGTLLINADNLTLDGTGKITAGAESGIGGDIKLNTTNLNISNDSQITSSAGGNENGGNITINTSNLNLKKNSDITANSFEGDGGNIEINTNFLSLKEKDNLTAASSSGNGGNIVINTSQIQLEKNSNISASTGGEGNGGNITIDTDFLIANSSENSDITTNAEFGNGGNISIEALSIIGIELREQLTELSDITVASEFGLDGTVAISNPDNNIIPIELNLTPDVIDANTIFTNSYCKINQNSKFIITGRGGLPLGDYREILPEYIWEDWRTIEEAASNNNTAIISNNNSPVTSSQNTSNSIQMVRGWKVNRQGKIILTAEPIMITPYVTYHKIPGCN